MSSVPKKYWDSTCFICFLNKGEDARRKICEDILGNARSGNVEIYTSMFTLVEVVRPKRIGSEPLPPWAIQAIEAIKKDHPEAERELETLWKRHQNSPPATKLTTDQIDKISAMFEWDFVQLINFDERVADRAVEIQRDYGLRPADSVHAASALVAKIPTFQHWDRDYRKIASLIQVENPQYFSEIGPLFKGIEGIDPNVGPTPADFEEVEESQPTLPVAAVAVASAPDDVEPPVPESPSSEPPPTS